MSRVDLAVKIAAIATIALCEGCVGAETHVVADSARYPVSMSRGVRDADGSLVTPDRREVVGSFETEPRAWALFYSLLSLNPTTDVSEEINRQVALHGGQAIVNLSISPRGCNWNYVYMFQNLPFWPGCVDVVMRGDIIRVKPIAPAPVATKDGGAR